MIFYNYNLGILIFFKLFFSCFCLLKRLQGLCQYLSQMGSAEVVWSIYLCTYHVWYYLPSSRGDMCNFHSQWSGSYLKTEWRNRTTARTIGNRTTQIVCTLQWIEPMAVWVVVNCVTTAPPRPQFFKLKII